MPHATESLEDVACGQDFYEYIEEHRANVVEALQAKYESITSYLKKIEELLEGRTTGSSEAMAAYYHYWERRIFNAIAAMLIRGTSQTFKQVYGLMNKLLRRSAVSPLTQEMQLQIIVPCFSSLTENICPSLFVSLQQLVAFEPSLLCHPQCAAGQQFFG
ncbi:hypothetical protein, conserved [Eimeria tenella]|uniref:Uncharacterized protein n=1 Tax=Eimeria tenella TaxID=5802 RepID=U6KHB5_EIMTE|nr:hypothetical protein, conserved [Eimeria tenella]CDJ37400.1 hypothetical protein, conserved [Eimeria tenella]|eukprot:XP_013228238.1 hypothetical protein, conserved [Eimeria tenella]